VSHCGDGYVWNMSVKCNGSAVNFNVCFGFMLFWQPDM
jgi:hypothetical protein